MKFHNHSLIRHDGKPYEPGIVELPKDVGERLGLDPVEGPTKDEREHEQRKGKK